MSSKRIISIEKFQPIPFDLKSFPEAKTEIHLQLRNTEKRKTRNVKQSMDCNVESQEKYQNAKMNPHQKENEEIVRKSRTAKQHQIRKLSPAKITKKSNSKALENKKSKKRKQLDDEDCQKRRKVIKVINLVDDDLVPIQSSPLEPISTSHSMHNSKFSNPFVLSQKSSTVSEYEDYMFAKQIQEQITQSQQKMDEEEAVRIQNQYLIEQQQSDFELAKIFESEMVVPFSTVPLSPRIWSPVSVPLLHYNPRVPPNGNRITRSRSNLENNMSYERLTQLEDVKMGYDRTILDSLPVFIYKGEKLSEEHCSICIEEFSKGTELRRLTCLHCFHRNCIDKWLAQSKKCPNCNTEILVKDDN